MTPGAENDLVTQLPLSDLMATLRPSLAKTKEPVYLVGGAVRDALLGRPSHDLDFAVAHDAVKLARAVANELNGAFYLLDAERGTARVILEQGVLDFARFRGENLPADLRGRDFTINALFYDPVTDTVIIRRDKGKCYSTAIPGENILWMSGNFAFRL